MDISQYIIGNGLEKNKEKSKRHNHYYTKTNTSECIVDCKTGLCSSNKVINDITQYVVKNIKKNVNPKEAMEIVKKELGCNSESCVLKKLKHELGEETVDRDLMLRFKTPGPRDSLSLLSNHNIDDTFLRWGLEYPDFYPCPFTMIDFDENPRFKFGRINLGHLINGKESYKTLDGRDHSGPFKTFACALNTDVSTGRGKHWVCLFADMRHKDWTIEYFNSTGNKPCKLVINWMERQRNNIKKETGNDPKVLSVTNLVHQEANTECGVYTLYYARARLDGLSHTFFTDNLIPDDKIVDFRKHVFRHQ